VGRLERQRALVTGASSGIGAAAAQLLAREGADVALVARNQSGVAAVARRVEGEGRRALRLHADVADRAALGRAVEEAVRELGGLDIVVVAAAAGAFGRFDEIPADDFDRCMAVTFTGAVNTIRAALPHLERSGGRLVVVGSAADTISLALLSPYVAAKHALDGFLEALRAELRAAGSAVTLSVVRPGAVDTPFWRHLTHPEGLTPPAIPPLAAYSAESVARAVVACAIEPRDTVTVGGATVALQAANAVARPAVERALALLARVGRARADRDGARNALWEPSGDGTIEGGLGGRPSALAAARLRRSRP
jgi:NAD(P)-dependent dehydrogenase (short-subunit alcohol dehydrogenase family)